MNKILEELNSYIDTLEIIDTHEHLPTREEHRDKNTDFFASYLFQYFKRDVISAGLSNEDYMKTKDLTLSPLEKWSIVEPYWKVAKNTGYGKIIDYTVKGVYGENGVNAKTVESLDYKFKQSLNGGQYKKVLKDLSKIKISVNVQTPVEDYDKDYFIMVPSLDFLIIPRTHADLENISSLAGIPLKSFDSYLEAVDIIIDNYMKKGYNILKIGVAYQRSLKFLRRTYDEAEQGFNEFFSSIHYADWFIKPIVSSIPFQDYILHYILEKANKNGLIMQIHTGILEGNGNIIANSEPQLLNNLFLEYPDIKFDVFHMGFPYQHQLSALGKMFANIKLNMCWAFAVSPTAAINALCEWLDTMPANKIFAFGGDYWLIDCVYGHQKLTRECVARALERKVSEGSFDIDEAKVIAKMLFYYNPAQFYNIK